MFSSPECKGKWRIILRKQCCVKKDKEEKTKILLLMCTFKQCVQIWSNKLKNGFDWVSSQISFYWKPTNGPDLSDTPTWTTVSTLSHQRTLRIYAHAWYTEAIWIKMMLLVQPNYWPVTSRTMLFFSAFFPWEGTHNYPSDSQHERISKQTWKERYIFGCHSLRQPV